MKDPRETTMSSRRSMSVGSGSVGILNKRFSSAIQHLNLARPKFSRPEFIFVGFEMA
jgi:hypothetical protein